MKVDDTIDGSDTHYTVKLNDKDVMHLIRKQGVFEFEGLCVHGHGFKVTIKNTTG